MHNFSPEEWETVLTWYNRTCSYKTTIKEHMLAQKIRQHIENMYLEQLAEEQGESELARMKEEMPF